MFIDAPAFSQVEIKILTFAMAVITILTIVFAGVVTLYLFFRPRRSQLPPGPYQWPLVGNLFQVASADPKYPHNAFMKIAETYGEVIFLRMGAVDTVIINGYEACKQALLAGDDFSGRINDKWFLDRTFSKEIGLLNGNNNIWKETRRFTMKQLHEYGYGNREQTESFINREVQETCDYIDGLIDSQDGVIVPEFLFNVANVNVVWGLASGTRFNHQDPKMLTLMSYVMELIRNSELAGGIQSAYPFMLDWFPRFLQFPKVQDVNRKFQSFFREVIEEYRRAGSYKTDPKNFIEKFLQHIDAADKSAPGIFTDESLIAVLYDFLAGSILTTAETLIYAVLQFAIQPEMQERMRHEIGVVFGKGRLSSVSEKQRTPFCTAFILEVLRMSTVVPLAPRKIYKDTKFRDFVIPKETNLLINYYSIHTDRNFWGDPENFRPDRFLDEKFNIIHADHVMSFSMGKRSCFGEPVAQANIYLFLTQLLQRFTFHADPNGTPPAAEFKPGLIVRLQHFSIRVKRRL